MTIEFGPRQVPDERTRLMLGWNHLKMSDLYEDIETVMGLSTQDAEDIRWCIQDALCGSQLYYVENDMVDLIVQAATTLPEDVRLLPELLPCPLGLAVFQHPPLESGAGPLDAVAWMSIVRDNRVPRITAVPFIDGHPDPSYSEIWMFGYARESPGWSLIGSGSWQFGVDVPNDVVGEPGRDLFALMALLQSPGVVEEWEHPQERHARKRSARAGANTDAVRVIRLRRHESHSKGDGESHYHHRWIVSGHWRSQPYGPGRLQRKPVWIMPHVKGPEGAPMLTGDKVRVL